MSAAEDTNPPDGLESTFALVTPSADDTEELRWNRVTESWDVRAGYRDRFLPAAEAHVYGSVMPSTEWLTRAAQLLPKAARTYCAHCHLIDTEAHAIVPDIWGEPQLLCVFRPDPAVVESFGGNGQRKHWGSRYGCASVAGTAVQGREWGPTYGRFRYGMPVTTHDAVEWRWCSRCQGTAWNVRNRIKTGLEESLRRTPSSDEVSRALRDDVEESFIEDQMRQ